MRGDFEDVRSWSDAPNNILGLILSKLCVGDIASFHMTCKTWNKGEPQVGAERILSDEELCICPCLIFPDKRFFHPLYNVWFRMDTMYALPKGVILAQNCGWLLLKLMEDNFFYNSFTGERIDLPASLFGCVAFSTPPTSPDCEIVQFRESNEDQIVVVTIKRGENEFQWKNICSSENFLLLMTHKTVFFQGKFYCLGKNGNLSIYDPKTNIQCGTTDAPIYLWEHFCTTECGRYLFEGDGDLWAVFVAFQGREVCVLKLNSSNMRWERVYNLGDRMVFLSYQSCIMERAKTRGAGNKIYFPKLMGRYCMFYSLATNMFHTVEKGSTYNSFRGSKDMPQCTWIKMNINPLSSQTCPKKLIW